LFRFARCIWHSDQAWDSSGSFHSLLVHGAQRRPTQPNGWYLFRRRFELQSSPRAATLSLTVDGRYQLFVNGGYIARGPSRASPAYQRFDVHEVTSRLRIGRNVLGVLVHVYGVDTAWYERASDCWQSIFGDGVLYCELELRDEDDFRVVPSDAAWRSRECAAWSRSTGRSGWGQDFIEDFDARRYPVGWQDIDFDDGGWPVCRELVASSTADELAKGWNPVEPFPTLLRREIPLLGEETTSPRYVVDVFGLQPDPSLPLERRLYEETAIPLVPDQLVNANALLTGDERVAIVRTMPGRDVAIVVAFECRHAGRPFIEIDALGGETIEVAVAETIPGEYGPQLPRPRRLACEGPLACAHLFRYVARRGSQRFEKFEWTAVKYMMVVVRDAPDGIRIRHVGSVAVTYPALPVGCFNCSDEVLNRLWEVGRYTLLQCTHDAWEDCPSREKRQWFGDGIVHYLVSAASYGPGMQPVDRQFFLHGVESQRPDGLMQMFAPGDHHASGILIPDFNLHFVCAAEQYLLHNDDEDTIEQIFPAIQRALQWFARQTGPNGLLVDLPYWHFIEWANVGRRGESTIVNAMYVGALRAAAALADALGSLRIAARHRTVAMGVATSLAQRHWSADRGAYVDSLDPITGRQEDRISQHANAAMIYWNIAPSHRWAQIISRITDESALRLTACPSVVPVGEAYDPATDVVRVNTFFAHFLYGALAKAGRMDLALSAMRHHYGAMLATGTETLWESFDPAASLCHAFSATPVHQLSAHTLGIAPIEPGFARFRVSPQLADLERASGAYPTPRGLVEVSWRRTDDGCEGEIRVPTGLIAMPIAAIGQALVTGSAECLAGTHYLRYRRTVHE